mgnify:CR=1 FL=1
MLDKVLNASTFIYRNSIGREATVIVLAVLTALPYFTLFRMRDFDDLSQSEHAEWLYPILFVLKPTTNFGIELCCYVSVFLWLACIVFTAAYLVSRVAERFVVRYIGVGTYGPP